MKVLSIILAFFAGFVTFPASFFSSSTNTDFSVDGSVMTKNSIYLNGEYTQCVFSENCKVTSEGTFSFSDKATIYINKQFYTWFNYFGIEYTSDSYLKCEICYKSGVKTKTEEFFLEPSENPTVFYSLVDNFLKKTKFNALVSLSFEPLDRDSASMTITGIGVFNRSIPDKEIYIENDGLKIGVDLLWGGALSYLEDTNSDVQLVKTDDGIHVDSNASERYNSAVLSDHVNLINRYDPGRLVQQSYYGTYSDDNYSSGIFMEQEWRYNPVQGGNQFGDNSKIVDIVVTEDMIYIKCQPLDWSKTSEHITPSYMEASYKIINGMLNVSCRFVDFSGYKAAESTQELPAFYCIEPFDNFVYCDNDKLVYEKELIFWPDANYPNFASTENWAAFTGDFSDSFGIGLYVPEDGSTSFLSGIFDRGNTSTENPAQEAPTSYMAVVKDFLFESFSAYEYEYYIATGDVTEIRNSFRTIK